MKMNCSCAARSSRLRFAGNGFTLVEILVATVILLVLVVALASVLNSVSTLSARATARLDAVRLGREIFDLMDKDLSQVVSTRPSLGATLPMQFLVNPSGFDAGYLNASSIFWQSTIATDQSSGNIDVVGYFVQRPTSKSSQLRRVRIEPTSSLYLNYSTPNAWLPSTSVTKFAASASSVPSDQLDSGWVADGVIGMWVRCLDANGVVITKNGAGTTQNYAFDSRLGYNSGTTASPSFAYSTFNVLPSYVEVGLVTVAPLEVGLIDSLPTVTVTVPTNLLSDMNTYVTAFNAQNHRVKTATVLTRRFRLYGSN